MFAVTSIRAITCTKKYIYRYKYTQVYLLLQVYPNIFTSYTQVYLLLQVYTSIFYNFYKINGEYFQTFIFSPFSICTSAVSLFLASLCLPIYGATFERMFRSRCLCAILRRSALSLFHWIDAPLSVFCLFCFIVIAASALHMLYLHFKLVFICSEGAIASLLWTAHF